MKHQEPDEQIGGLESLAELVHLWRRRSQKYARAFLAATICVDFGRQRRLLQTDMQDAHFDHRNIAHLIEDVGALLQHDSAISRCALTDVYAEGLVEAVQDFTNAYAQRKLTDDELADEGLRLLFDYDCLALILRVLSEVPLSTAARTHLRREQQILDQAARLVERNLLAFFAAAPMINDYCLEWNVEADSVLSQVAGLGSPEADLLWTERHRAPAPLSALTAACPDENMIAEYFAGVLPAAHQPEFELHLRDCGHCRGLLDELTATVISMPACLPPASKRALPPALRQPGMKERAQTAIQRAMETICEVVEFLLPPPELAVARGVAASSPFLQLDDLLRREVLIETPQVQAVLFLRGRHLYLSVLAEPPQTVTARRLVDAQTRSRWPTTTDEEENIFLGHAADLGGKQLELSFRVGTRRFRTQVHFREQGENQA